MARSIEQIKEEFYQYFPDLRRDSKFDITSPETDIYNCIAFAMGFEDRRVDYSPEIEGHWWPPIPVCDEKPSSLVEAFRFMKFIECEDGSIEEGYDKVALYKVKEGYNQFGIWEPEHWTHASKIVDVNECHSKMGEMNDIHHRDGDVFAGTIYGEIFQYMKRPIKDRSIVDSFPTGDDCEFEVFW